MHNCPSFGQAMFPKVALCPTFDTCEGAVHEWDGSEGTDLQSPAGMPPPEFASAAAAGEEPLIRRILCHTAPLLTRVIRPAL